MLKFTATGDNFISIFANGTLTNVGGNTNRFTVSGGNQIGATAGDYTRMLNYESVVPLLSGTNELYVVIGDQGGATGMIFGGFTEIVPEPSTYAMALAGLACGGHSMWRRRKRV